MNLENGLRLLYKSNVQQRKPVVVNFYPKVTKGCILFGNISFIDLALAHIFDCIIHNN